MKFVSIFTLVFLLVGFTAYQYERESPVFEATLTVPNAEQEKLLDEYFTQYELLDFDLQGLATLSEKSIGTFDFTLNVDELHSWEMSLERYDMRSPDFKHILYTEDGEVEVPLTVVHSFEGHLKGNPESAVRLNIYPDHMSGFVRENGVQYFIESLSNLSDIAADKALVLYKSNDYLPLSKEEAASMCAADKLSTYVEHVQDNEVAKRAGAPLVLPCMQFQIVTNADYELFQRFGSNANAVFNALNEVIFLADDVFISNFNLRFNWTMHANWQVPEGFDDYQINDRWYDFRDFFNYAGSDIVRDAVFLFSAKTPCSNHGVMYMGSVCTSLANSYGLGMWVGSHSGANLTTDQRARILGHELAHGFNANHDCDSCARLMSKNNPFGTSNWSFSSARIDEITHHLTHFNSCLSACPSGTCATNPIPPDHLTTTVSLFAAEELCCKAEDAIKSYVVHQNEINDILFAEKEAYKTVQQAFEALKSESLFFVANAFISGSKETISPEQYDLFDDFLVELGKAAQSDELRTAIAAVRERLPVMAGKDLKSAIIAFDRTDIAVPPAQGGTRHEDGQIMLRLLNSLSNPTILDFKAPDSRGHVSIFLYDAAGRRVSTLMENRLLTDGFLQQELDKRELNAGVYFIRLEYISEEKNFYETIKLPVIK